MPRAMTIIAVFLLLAMGCSSSTRKASRQEPGPVYASAGGPTETASIGKLQTDVDSALALFDFGDLADFFVLRDSLREKMASLAKANPAIRSDPEFDKILEGLHDLDSLEIVRSFTRGEGAVVDSIALTFEEWPEAAPRELDRRTSHRRPRREVVEPGALEIREDVFPTLANDRIDFWIRYFTGPGKERFGRALYRMQLHRPLVEDILEEQGLPVELICVPIIESGYVLKARSRARAVGPWQFISGTARIYGLRVNWWYDERRNIVASTYAAANYLKDLYEIWSSWPLALAAYNCGEYRVARAVARQKTTDFWKLDLPRQTERYVPKFLAALYIVRQPEKYGFTIPDVEPIKFDQVTISDATDLKLIAKSAETTVDVLRELNPSLLRWATPPKTKVEVKVPKGSGEVCEAALAAIPPNERVTWRKHRVRRGETLSTIASEYRTSVSALKQLNGIRNAHRIRAGTTLIVPMHGSFSEMASSEPQYKTKRRNLDKKALENYAKRYAPPANHKRVVYRVKDRDTLGEIAEVYQTSARKLRAWNNLSYRSYIYPGQKLVIYVPESFDVTNVTPTPKAPNENDYVRRSYTVKKGDTIYAISRRFNVSMADVLAWNGKSSREKIYPGQKLDIWQKKSE